MQPAPFIPRDTRLPPPPFVPPNRAERIIAITVCALAIILLLLGSLSLAKVGALSNVGATGGGLILGSAFIVPCVILKLIMPYVKNRVVNPIPSFEALSSAPAFLQFLTFDGRIIVLDDETPLQLTYSIVFQTDTTGKTEPSTLYNVKDIKNFFSRLRSDFDRECYKDGFVYRIILDFSISNEEGKTHTYNLTYSSPHLSV